MKKIVLITSILVLILITSLVKNSTKNIEDQIFTKNENIRSLKAEFGDVMLEYNFLSSPEKLMEYQFQYFKDDLVKMDITKVKKVYIGKDFLTITSFKKKTKDNERQ